MHAVLPMPANGLGLHLLRDTLEKHSEPALTATNEGSSPSPHSLTGSECVKAWERVPREPGFHLTNDSTALTTLDGDRSSEVQSVRKRPHSIQTEYLSGSLGKGAVLAGPSLMASFVEHGTASKPYQRALPAEEASYPEHRSSADLRDREGNQVHKPSTLELLHTNLSSRRKGTPSERNRSASDETGVDQRSDHVQVVKKRQRASRSRTGCGTCRKRKKKCDEAKPKCNNCLRGNYECAGYATQPPWLETDAAKAALRLQPQEQMSMAKIALSHVVHAPYDKPNGEHVTPIGLRTFRDWVSKADEQERKPQ